MHTQTFLALFSVLQGVTALYTLPKPPLPRDTEHSGDVFDAIQSDVLKRSTDDAKFPLNFNVTNQTLFNGNFGGGTLTVKCVECKTTGQVIASAMLPNISDIDITEPGDIFNSSMIGLTFNGVGATVDLDLTAAASGDFSVPLLKTETPLGIAGPGFQIGVVFSVDLVLGISAQIETEGGFKVAIPDGSSFMILLDDEKPNVANFNGASASLLPLKVDLPADVTVALRLGVQAGVMLPDLGIIDAKALAGASISIPEIILKESASFPINNTCAIPVSAEININAGVFVDIGADIGGIDLGDFNPNATTTLFSAATSTCLGSGSTSLANTSTTSPPESSSKTSYSVSALPTTSSLPAASGLPASQLYPSPSLGSPPSMGTEPPALVIVVVDSSPQGSPPQDAGNGVDDIAVIVQNLARRTAYPITLQSLATPITNYAAAATAT